MEPLAKDFAIFLRFLSNFFSSSESIKAHDLPLLCPFFIGPPLTSKFNSSLILSSPSLSSSLLFVASIYYFIILLFYLFIFIFILFLFYFIYLLIEYFILF